MLCLAVEMIVLAGSRSAEDQQQLSSSACTTEHEAHRLRRLCAQLEFDFEFEKEKKMNEHESKPNAS